MYLNMVIIVYIKYLINVFYLVSGSCFVSGPVMLLHHTLSIAGLSVTFAMKTYGIEIVTTIFGAEFTNPLLQLRWFLKETNNYDSLLGDIVDISFMALFGILRIGLGTILLYAHLTMPTTDWLGSLGGTCIYSVGWLFWISIVQYGYKKYKRRHLQSKARLEKKKDQNGTSPCTSKTNGHSNHVGYTNGEIEQNGHSEVNGNLRKRQTGDISNGVNGCNN